jgi:hypothetical protein
MAAAARRKISYYYKALLNELNTYMDKLVKANTSDKSLVSELNAQREAFATEINECETRCLSKYPTARGRKPTSAATAEENTDKKDIFTSFCFFIQLNPESFVSTEDDEGKEDDYDGLGYRTSMVKRDVTGWPVSCLIDWRLIVTDKFVHKQHIKCFQELLYFTSAFDDSNLIGHSAPKLIKLVKDMFFVVSPLATV